MAGYLIDDASAKRLGKMLNAWEGGGFSDGRAGNKEFNFGGSFPGINVVKVTGPQNANGTWPGIVRFWNNGTKTYDDGAKCRIREVNGSTLSQVHYLGRLAGTDEVSGAKYPVYLVQIGATVTSGISGSGQSGSGSGQSGSGQSGSIESGQSGISGSLVSGSGVSGSGVSGSVVSGQSGQSGISGSGVSGSGVSGVSGSVVSGSIESGSGSGISGSLSGQSGSDQSGQSGQSGVSGQSGSIGSGSNPCTAPNTLLIQVVTDVQCVNGNIVVTKQTIAIPGGAIC